VALPGRRNHKYAAKTFSGSQDRVRPRGLSGVRRHSHRTALNIPIDGEMVRCDRHSYRHDALAVASAAASIRAWRRARAWTKASSKGSVGALGVLVLSTVDPPSSLLWPYHVANHVAWICGGPKGTQGNPP